MSDVVDRYQLFANEIEVSLETGLVGLVQVAAALLYFRRIQIAGVVRLGSIIPSNLLLGQHLK